MWLLCSTGLWSHGGRGKGGVAGVMVTAHELAGELRRRRVGRQALVDDVDRADAATWLPGDLRNVPSSTLVLAALTLARKAEAGR